MLTNKKLFLGMCFMLPIILKAQNKDQLTADTLKVYQVEEVEVTSKYYKRYNIKEMSEGLRLRTSLLNTSQNIQILDGEIFRDQAVTNLNESLTRNVSGTMREELHNGISPDIYSRAGYISAQRNGVDLRPLGKGPIGDDVAIIDRVEFLKGPAGFMHAMSDPAGSYNVVTKKPTGETRRSIDVLMGSFNQLRAAVDLEGKFEGAEKLQYRLNLMGMKANGFMEHDRNNRILFAPSLKYQINERSSITAEYIYQQLNYLLLSEAQMSPYGYGTLPNDFTITDPSVRPFSGNDHNMFLTYQNSFKNNWEFTAKASYITMGYDGSIFWVNGANKQNPDILDRNLVYDSNKYNVFSTQFYLNGNFNTGRLKHNFITGVDINNKSSNSRDTWGTATAVYPLSISNPVYSTTIMNNGIGGDFASENDFYSEGNIVERRLFYASVYAMDELSMLNDRLRITLGLRLTASYGNSTDYGAKTETDDLVLTPRLGVNYSLTKDASLYFLHDRTYLPQSGISVEGNALKPIRGINYELGFKRDWAEGRWNTTLAIYHIERNQLVSVDPTSNLIYQTGVSQSRGFEFDMKGQLAKGLNAIVNYAYTDSEITEDEYNPELIGRATPNLVKHIQNTWLNYYLPIQKLSGFSLSAGYQLLMGRTERFPNATSQPLEDNFRLDVGAGWNNEKYKINLIVNNVLNRKMYSTAWRNGANDMYYWVQMAPIHARLSLRVNL